MYGPHTSDPYNRIGAICELNMFTASLVGYLESLILLFKAAIVRFAQILRSSRVGIKEQSFAEIVKPRYLKHGCFACES